MKNLFEDLAGVLRGFLPDSGRYVHQSGFLFWNRDDCKQVLPIGPSRLHRARTREHPEDVRSLRVWMELAGPKRASRCLRAWFTGLPQVCRGRFPGLPFCAEDCSPVYLVPESFPFVPQPDSFTDGIGNDENVVELVFFEPLNCFGIFVGGLAENIEEGVGNVFQPGDGSGFVRHAVGQDSEFRVRAFEQPHHRLFVPLQAVGEGRPFRIAIVKQLLEMGFGSAHGFLEILVDLDRVLGDVHRVSACRFHACIFIGVVRGGFCEPGVSAGHLARLAGKSPRRGLFAETVLDICPGRLGSEELSRVFKEGYRNIWRKAALPGSGPGDSSASWFPGQAGTLNPKSVIRLWGDCPLVSCSMLLA